MLSETQIDVITFLSCAVWFGLINGGFAGVIAGALIRPIRTRRMLSCFAGSFLAALPSATAAISVSLVVAVLQMVLCRPGHKAGWDVPVWSTSIQAIAIFAAGIAAAFLAQRPRLRSPPIWSLALSALLGACLGALGWLDTAFDGYYVLKTNARPIQQAITGSLVGGIAVLLWCGVLHIWHRQAKTLQATASAPRS
jgi:hypothetical protein